VGRYTTIAGVVVGIGTAFLAAGYSNINNYIQTLFSFFNVPIFLAFIVGMFWKGAGRSSGFWGMLVGTLVSFGIFILYQVGVIPFRSDLGENQWAAIISFLVGLVAMVIATRFSEPKTDEELEGLVYGRQTITVTTTKSRGIAGVLKNPVALGTLSLALCALAYIYIEIVN
jgi:SSS family solute:Na+ symporter